MYKKLLITALLLIAVTSVAVHFISAETSEDTPSTYGLDTILPYIDSNRYSHLKTDEVAVSRDLDTGLTLMNTSMGDVYIDEDSLAFQVNNNGYVYASSPLIYDDELPVSALYSMDSALNIQSFNLNNSNYALVRETLFTPGTTVNIDYITNGFDAKIKFGTTKIQLHLIVIFEGDNITVSIPDDQIVETEQYKLKAVQVYKDFGATYKDETPGYVFIPDGVGALIDYKANDLGTPNYKKEIYGSDLSYTTESNLQTEDSAEYRVYVPVFGFVHGVDQNAVFANITSGGMYGSINVYYPSRNRGYTTVFSEFVYRKTYAQPVDQIGNTITLLQDSRNTVDMKIEYTLLSGEDANYVGMAMNYRDYLISEGASTLSTVDQTPYLLSYMGAEKIEGTLWTKTLQLSTLESILETIEDITGELDAKPAVSLAGYTADGVTWSSPKYTKLSRSFGTDSELEELHELVSSIYLVMDHIMASSESGDYSKISDIAKKINEQIYTFQLSTSENYLLSLDAVEKNFIASSSSFNQEEVGYAYNSFGSILYDDFKEEETVLDQVALMRELLESLETEVALYDANSYLWDLMDVSMDTVMYSSQYITFDDTVPFIPIALSNISRLYSPSTTFLPYARDDLLRMIDYHIYPSFLVTTDADQDLQKSNLSYIYVSNYSVIKPMIVNYYEFMNDALKDTLNATIINRTVLEEGLVMVAYDNGTEIIINYQDHDIDVFGITVPAKYYQVGDFE